MNDFIKVSYLNKIERANERFAKMSLSDCMEMWNRIACDHYCRFMEMREMGDLEWWNTLSNELGAWGLVQAVLSSGGLFNDSDKYFFFDQDNEQMISFSTKQELIEVMGNDFFIENMLND